MKVNRFVMLMVSVGLVFGLMSGCGGGGSSDSSTTSTEIEENVFVKQNEFAQQSVPASYALYEALYEEIGLVTNALGEGWADSDWTEDDIRNVLNEEEIEQLISQLVAIHNDKVIPSAEAVEVSSNGLNSTEQEIQNLLNLSAGFAKPIEARIEGSDILIATTILTTWTAIGLDFAGYSLINFPKTDDNITKNVAVVKEYNQKLITEGVPEAGKAGVISLATSVVTSGLSSLATASKSWKLFLDTFSFVDSVNSVVVGVNKCFEANTTSEKQTDIILNALDPADGDVEISYLGQSDEDGVFHNIPEGDMTFVLFSEGNVRSVSSCIDFSGDEELITENITVTPIADFENLINDGDVIPTDPNTDSSNIQVSIPGYTNTFVSNRTEMSFGALNDGPYIYPAFTASDATSPEEVPMSDIFTMMFNTTLSAGNTYPLSEDGDGNANVWFATPQIVDEDGSRIVFSEVSGSFTLTEYGTNVGDKLSGTFSCNVVGKRSEDDVINGTISGTFSGTLSASELSAAEQDVAVSKSMKISF